MQVAFGISAFVLFLFKHNSSKTPQEHYRKLEKIGYKLSVNQVLVSLDPALDYLKEKGLQNIYAIANDSVSEYIKMKGFTLDDKNCKSVLVPPNFLNGHLCLSNECVFHYTQTYPNEYVDWQDQISVKWNDPMLKINWPINNPIVSKKDNSNKLLRELLL